MKRFLAIVLLIILFIVTVTVPFLLLGGQRFAMFSDQEKAVTTFILATLELVGIVVSIIMVVIILYQYFRYRRPYRLIFDAFSNESDLINNEKKPLNLSMLAQEELIRQFKIIYYEVNGYSNKDKKRQDFEPLVADESYIEDGPLGDGFGTYVSVDQIKKGGMIEDLKDVIKFLKDPKGINLMSLVGEIVPKEVAPISKFIEAIIPPHVIQTTAYLQWRSNVTDSDVSDDSSDKVGITFKYVDLGNQRNLMVRTLWWQPEDKSKEAAGTRSADKRKMVNKTISNKVADHYIELLSPATHWMALMFWEQKLLSNVPSVNRIIKIREKRRQSRIFYLLGALYYAHADQFPAYKSFFCQLAVEHFRQASITDLNWNLPYLYLANLYTFKAQETQGEKSEKLRQDAQNLYKAALEHTKATNEHTRPRIILAKALAELTAGVQSKNLTVIKGSVQQVEELQKEIDPASFDPRRADCAAYLYNLAIWYEIAYDKFVDIAYVSSRDEARRYLTYSLVRSPSLRNKVENEETFKSMKDEGDLEHLLELLKEALDRNPNLTVLTGEKFKCEIDTILQIVDQRLGRPTCNQQA